MHCCRIYHETGMIIKFAIGEVPAAYDSSIAEEERSHGSFLRIPVEMVCFHLLLQGMRAARIAGAPCSDAQRR